MRKNGTSADDLLSSWKSFDLLMKTLSRSMWSKSLLYSFSLCCKSTIYKYYQPRFYWDSKRRVLLPGFLSYSLSCRTEFSNIANPLVPFSSLLHTATKSVDKAHSFYSIFTKLLILIITILIIIAFEILICNSLTNGTDIDITPYVHYNTTIN